MPSFFSKLKGRDGLAKHKEKYPQVTEAAAKPQWEDAWLRKSVAPNEVQELLRGCVAEIKARGLDIPFLLLPFRPTSDPSAARTFIRHHFEKNLRGEYLAQELRLTEPMVLCSILKWCWCRLPGGVVGWEAYELFRVGEIDSNMARNSFATFIPISVDSDVRQQIIFDFFDLLSAIAAHSKVNGLSGRKLSRLAGWWAFEQADNKSGFEEGYKEWIAAANATSHLFFAYLRSLSPDQAKGLSGMTNLPTSLQKLVLETEYPPKYPANMQTKIFKISMIVDTVSPTPFALLRRASHFQYRDEDKELKKLAEYEDPVKSLADECRRVLKSISSANQLQVSRSKVSAGLNDASWSRFQDLGFGEDYNNEEDDEYDEIGTLKRQRHRPRTILTPKNPMIGRPTTPSWADFLSSGFADQEASAPSALLLPPGISLPPIEVRTPSSSSRDRNELSQLEPGELASIAKFNLDHAFWWAWICSLAVEERPERKAAFGRCALIETVIFGSTWFVLEEKVRGAAQSPHEDINVSEKKHFWGRSKRGKDLNWRKLSVRQPPDASSSRSPIFPTTPHSTFSNSSIGSEPHVRIQAAAAKLQQQQRDDARQPDMQSRGTDQTTATKTSSTMTLQPVVLSEVSPAMRWASKYDKEAIKGNYLKSSSTGRGNGEQMDSTKGLQHENISGDVTNNKISSSTTPTKIPVPNSPASMKDNILRPRIEAAQNISESVSLGNSLPARKNVADIITTRSSVDMEPSSPQTPTSLRRNSSSAGFKKLFGRNKTQNVKGSDHPPQATNGREALERKTRVGSSLVRKLSGIRRRSFTPSEKGDTRLSPSEAVPVSGKRSSVVSNQHDNLEARTSTAQDSISRVNTHEAQEAQEAFSNFDQEGPPDDSSVRVSKDGSPIDNLRNVSLPFSPQDYKEDTSHKHRSPPIDRWAQIRKNAAERASQRQTDLQPKEDQSFQKDIEDKDTSGDESIETRVARIKARVAELTGKMEVGGIPTVTIASPTRLSPRS